LKKLRLTYWIVRLMFTNSITTTNLQTEFAFTRVPNTALLRGRASLGRALTFRNAIWLPLQDGKMFSSSGMATTLFFEAQGFRWDLHIWFTPRDTTLSSAATTNREFPCPWKSRNITKILASTRLQRK